MLNPVRGCNIEVAKVTVRLNIWCWLEMQQDRRLARSMSNRHAAHLYPAIEQLLRAGSAQRPPPCCVETRHPRDHWEYMAYRAMKRRLQLPGFLYVLCLVSNWVPTLR